MTPFVQQQLAAIRALHEAHADDMQDDTLRLDMIEGETQALEAIDWLIRKQREEAENIKALKALADFYDTRKSKAQARKDAYRAMIHALMEAMKVEKIKRIGGTASISAGKFSVSIDDVNELPQGFFETVRKPKTSDISAALEAGETIPGATRVQGNPFLTVK